MIFRTDFSTIALGVTQFLQTLTRTSPRLVLLEVTKVDTLFKINLNGQYVQHDIHKDISKRPTQLISKIVSVFAKNVKNIFMSEGLQLTLKHVALHKDTLKVSFIFRIISFCLLLVTFYSIMGIHPCR